MVIDPVESYRTTSHVSTLRYAFLEEIRAGSKGALTSRRPPYRPPGGSHADWLGRDHVTPLNVSSDYCLLAVPGALINVRLKGREEQRIRGDGLRFSRLSRSFHRQDSLASSASRDHVEGIVYPRSKFARTVRTV